MYFVYLSLDVSHPIRHTKASWHKTVHLNPSTCPPSSNSTQIPNPHSSPSSFSSYFFDGSSSPSAPINNQVVMSSNQHFRSHTAASRPFTRSLQLTESTKVACTHKKTTPTTSAGSTVSLTTTINTLPSSGSYRIAPARKRMASATANANNTWTYTKMRMSSSDSNVQPSMRINSLPSSFATPSRKRTAPNIVDANNADDERALVPSPPTKRHAKMYWRKLFNSPLIFTITTDVNLLLKITSYLEPRAWVEFSMTCKTLGSPQQIQSLSLVDTAAKLFVSSLGPRASLQLPKHNLESWIGYSQAHLFRLKDLTFKHAYGNIQVKSPSLIKVLGPGTAICSEPMRSGVHVADFSLSGGQGLRTRIGIIRRVAPLSQEKNPFNPLSSIHFEHMLSQRNVLWGHKKHVHCCVFNCNNGTCTVSDWNDWASTGSVSMDFQGDNCETASAKILSMKETRGVLRLRLDLSSGTISAFVDGMFAGEMESQLDGEYVWAVIGEQSSMWPMDPTSPTLIRVKRITSVD